MQPAEVVLNSESNFEQAAQNEEPQNADLDPEDVNEGKPLPYRCTVLILI